MREVCALCELSGFFFLAVHIWRMRCMGSVCVCVLHMEEGLVCVQEVCGLCGCGLGCACRALVC